MNHAGLPTGNQLLPLWDKGGVTSYDNKRTWRSNVGFMAPYPEQDIYVQGTWLDENLKTKHIGSLEPTSIGQPYEQKVQIGGSSKPISRTSDTLTLNIGLKNSGTVLLADVLVNKISMKNAQGTVVKTTTKLSLSAGTLYVNKEYSKDVTFPATIGNTLDIVELTIEGKRIGEGEDLTYNGLARLSRYKPFKIVLLVTLP